MKRFIRNHKMIMILVTLAIMCIMFSVKGQAADKYYMGNFSDSGKAIKVGNYYFTEKTETVGESHTDYLYSSKTKTGKKTLLAKSEYNNGNGNFINCRIITKGTTVYYMINNKLYTININGKNNKLFKKLAGNTPDLISIYNNTLYYTQYLGYEESDKGRNKGPLHSLSLTTKKDKKFSVSFDQIANARGIKFESRYLYLYKGRPCWLGHMDIDKINVFDCKTGKIVSSLKNVFIWDIFKSNGKLYYASRTKSNNITTFKVYTADLSGKNQKFIKSFKGGWVESIDSKYIYYSNQESDYNRYNIKTKKSEQVTKKQYKGENDIAEYIEY